MERRTAVQHLEADQITALMRQAFPGCELIRYELLTNGKCNTNYRVRVTGVAQDLLLRLYIREPRACAMEQNLAGRLPNEVPLAETLFADPAGDPPFAVQRWVAGTLMADWVTTATPPELSALAQDLGRVLGHIGTVQFATAGFLAPNLSLTPAFDSAVDFYYPHVQTWLQGNAEKRLGEALAQSAWRFMCEHRALLDPVRYDHQLIHGDYSPYNILVNSDGDSPRVAAVLDWEFASAGSNLLDVGILYRRERLMPPHLAEAFASGYAQAGTSLATNWLRMARLLDLVNLVCLLDSGDGQPAMCAEAVQLVRDTVNSQRV